MAASDNHSEEPKTTNKNSITTDNPRQGPTRLSLTLLIVVVIVVTSVCSVYRNELFSSIRKMSAKVFSTHSSSQLTGNVSVNKSTESGPGISLVAPSAPTAEINSEKADKLAMSAGSSPKAPSTEFQPLASFKDQEQSKAASNESETPPIAKTNVPGETAPLRQSTPPLDSDLQKRPTSQNAASDHKSNFVSQTNSNELSKATEQSNELSKKAGVGAGLSSSSSSKPKSTDLANPEKVTKRNVSQEFQLPGSIRIKIHNYVGVYNKWALMVIVDNSAVMDRESKRWKPARVKLAKEFALGLLEAIPTGSKIAMKDFSCKGDPSKEKSPACPVHTVYNWTEYPYKGLKEKINSMGSGKATNPCGAVINSIKSDFLGIGTHVPRLLLLTCGQAKCPSKETTRVLNRQSPGTKVTIDVLGIGMPSKRHPTYSILAKKSGGLFLSVETQAQLEAAMERYKKALRVSTFQKVEIRNDKATVSVAPDEDIALAPGNYTVVLPKLKGIADSHRAIPNVKIKSGHSTIIEVNPKKGKATIKVVDRERINP